MFGDGYCVEPSARFGKVLLMPDVSDAEVIVQSWSTPEAFGMIFDRHFASIHRYVARRLSATDADDVAGEVFRIAFEKRRGFDSSRVSALPWLYGITSNLVLKHRRREARALRAMARYRTVHQPQRWNGNVEDLVDARLDAQRSHKHVVEALLQLTGEERDLVLLAVFADLTYRELAEATGLPEGTVRSKLSRSKAKLRERLGPIGEELAEPPTSPAEGGTQ